MTSFHRPCLAFSLPALICSTYVLFSQPVLIPVGAGLISPALTALGLLSDGLGFDPDALGIPFLLPLLRFRRFSAGGRSLAAPQQPHSCLSRCLSPPYARNPQQQTFSFYS
jgi:hypothetical protein